MKCVWIQSASEVHVYFYIFDACCPDNTFIALVNVLPLYIGVGLRVLPFLRFHKTLCLLQFPFLYALENLYFIGIIRDPSATFTFLVCFLFVLPSLLFFFFLWLCLLSGFGIESFFFFSEGVHIIRRWGYGDDAPGCVWGIPNLYFEAWDWGTPIYVGP